MSIKSKRIHIKAIRYNFTPEMMENIQEFTRVHQFDERNKYKEEWKCWINTKEIELKVSNEIIRLRDEGCTWEDEIIKEKMYKSSKFYYKKKMQTKTNDDDKIKTQEKYKGFTKQFLRSIDGYIHEKIKEKSRNIEDTIGNKSLDVVPTKIYNEYCLNHKDEIKKEILRLREIS